MIRSPLILSWALIPLTISTFLYIAFFYYGSSFLNQLITDNLTPMLQTFPQWFLTAATVTLKIIVWLLLATIGALSFTIISGIISAPFNDALSKATQNVIQQKNSSNKKKSTGDIDLSIKDSVFLEGKRMFILIAGGIFALLMGIIPFLQLPAIALGAYLLAFEYFGYPFARKSKSIFPVLIYAFRNPLISFGFGCALLLMMTVPLVSIFYLPVAVVSGTILFYEIEDFR